MLKRLVALSILSSCVSCSSVMSYKYYGLGELPDQCYDAKLWDKTGGQDLNFLICKPTPDSKSPCIVMSAEEFFKMKQDYLDTKNKLRDTQRGD